MMLFRPEFLQPSPDAPADGILFRLARLGGHLALDEEELRAVTAAMVRMEKDAGNGAAPSDLHPLLPYQLYALLLRLCIVVARQDACDDKQPGSRRRFRQFQLLLETQYATWHQVADYAGRLGCSERSLTRATLDMAGVSAKHFITSRINLEAKRLLAHTARPVAVIADSLGFDETTNFIKFFKREVGRTPAEYRRGSLPVVHEPRHGSAQSLSECQTDPRCL